jgi:hypothetical protein
MLYENGFSELSFYGYFNGFINGVGQAQTFTSGWFSMAFYNTNLGSYENTNSTVEDGYGVATVITPTFQIGEVNDAFWLNGTTLIICGNFNFLSEDGPGGATGFLPVKPGMTGFAVGDFSGTAPTYWGGSPTVAGGYQYGLCLRFSEALSSAGTDIFLCSGNPPVPPLIYNGSTNTLVFATGPVPPAGSIRQSWNCIISPAVAIDIGFGPTKYDFILYQDIITPFETYVLWFSAATGNVAQAMIPTPTGVASQYVQVVYPVQYGGPYTGLPSLGWFNDTTGFTQLAGLNFEGKDGLYVFDPAVHGGLAFTGVFFAEGVAAPGYTTATFATGGVPQGPPQSQSYIATKDLKGWIQIGAKTQGITYT